jgi:hypothetical protein
MSTIFFLSSNSDLHFNIIVKAIVVIVAAVLPMLSLTRSIVRLLCSVAIYYLQQCPPSVSCYRASCPDGTRPMSFRCIRDSLLRLTMTKHHEMQVHGEVACCRVVKILALL